MKQPSTTAPPGHGLREILQILVDEEDLAGSVTNRDLPQYRLG